MRNLSRAVTLQLMAYFAVEYTYTDDKALVDGVRPTHREFLRSLEGNGVVATGPLPDSLPPKALLIVQAESQSEAAALLADDPMALEGAIMATRIERWDPVIEVFAN